MPEREACLRAVRSRDGRFDGVFVNAVSSTGIYCRPSCPAVTPKDHNMSFYPSAAAAVAAGYRACRRCRPDASPGSPEWDARSDTVARTMRLIRDGVVDRDGVPGLAARLGYSVRQVERVMLAELGAGPAALARAQRAYTARLLTESTDLPLSDVAFAAGFSSIRTFNEAIAQVYATTPSALRERATKHPPTALRGRAAKHPPTALTGRAAKHPPKDTIPEAAEGRSRRVDMVVHLKLPRREPFESDRLFGHLAATAAPETEEWRDGALRIALRLPVAHGIAELTPKPTHIAATLRLVDPRDLAPAIARCRALLDLDADPVAVGEVLGRDAALGPLWHAMPGRRIPRTTDPETLALRAVIAHQVSVRAAATIAGRLAAEVGEPVSDPAGGLTHLFPTAAALATWLDGRLTADDGSAGVLPMPRARARTLHILATRLANRTIDLSPGADWTQARARLAEIPGIGPWTVEIIALRGLGDPDAFPGSDLGVRAGLERLGLVGAADLWRPWRGYAVQYLWAAAVQPINLDPINRVPGRIPAVPVQPEAS